MDRCIFVAIALLLLSSALADSTTSKGYADVDHADLRSEIARLIQYGKDAYGKMRTVDLDSGIVKLDSAITLAEEHFGPKDTTIATALVWQSMLYGWKMDISKCEALVNRALDLYVSQLGPDHPAVAAALWVKGGLYSYTKRVSEGQSLRLRAIELLESHPDFDPDLRAHVLLDIGANHAQRQEYLPAIAARKRALLIFEQVHGPDHWTVGFSCQTIGFAYYLLRNDDSALVYHERAQEVYRRSLGPEMPRTAYHLGQLSRVYWRQGQLDRRGEMLYRALSVLESTVGKGHLWVAEVVQQIAWHEMATGRHDHAVLFAERAAQLGGEIDLLGWAYWTKSLARSLHERGDISESLAAYREMLSSQQDIVSGLFVHTSEESKMKYLRTYPLIYDPLVDLAVKSDSPEAMETALQMVLAGKAVIVDALAAERKTAYCSGDTLLKDMLSDHATVCEELAGLITTGGLNLPSSIIRDTVAILNASKDRLESEISGRCAEFVEAYAVKKLAVQDVAGTMTKHSVLWEFKKYWPQQIIDGQFKWRPSHYVVFVLQCDGHVSLVDLGEAAPIDSLIDKFQFVMSEAPSVIAHEGEARAVASLFEITNQLHDRLISPLESTMTEGDRILISADAKLNLLPFAILTSPTGFLVETHEVTYLSSGRDLLDLHQPATNIGNTAFVVTAPDFDSEPTTAKVPVLAQADGLIEATRTRGPSDRSECLAVPFDPLPATAGEGETITSMLSSSSTITVTNYTGLNASEEFLKQIKEPPRILHLATHGYFCSRADFSDAGHAIDNPLLYSGLAMAGSNLTITGEYESGNHIQDGILTSLEVSGLNLVGTEVVILSACQSGLGEVENGEGVYGLRRAFQHAGARSIIMSMYDVPDQSTAALMERFYENWLAGSRKAAALREASLSMLRERREEKGVAHPFFWGGFILVGDPN